LTFVLHTLFRLYYYGEAFPNTYYLKLSGFSLAERVSRGVEMLLPVMSQHLTMGIGKPLHRAGRAATVHVEPFRGHIASDECQVHAAIQLAVIETPHQTGHRRAEMPPLPGQETAVDGARSVS
jgi:hypothetical protein